MSTDAGVSRRDAEVILCGEDGCEQLGDQTAV